MEPLTVLIILLVVVSVASLSALYVLAVKYEPVRKKKAERKDRADWLTRHQLEILKSINEHGRGGVPLWHTDISLSTIRSLAKRGYVDTRSRSRVVATSHGRRRLTQPWPQEQPTGDQKDRGDVVASGAAEIAPADAEGGLPEAKRPSIHGL